MFKASQTKEMRNSGTDCQRLGSVDRHEANRAWPESIQNAIKAWVRRCSLIECLVVAGPEILSVSENQQAVFQSIAKPLAKQRGGVPVAGRLSSDYGDRFHPILKEHRHHDGIDIAAPKGSPIHSVKDGIVSFAGVQGGYGNVVEIDHGNGWVTKYAHCDTIAVKVGDKVNASEVIAAVGSTGRSTGPHLHFEVERHGKSKSIENSVEVQIRIKPIWSFSR